MTTAIITKQEWKGINLFLKCILYEFACPFVIECLLYIWVQTDLYKVNHTHTIGITLCSQKFSFLYFANYLPHHRMVQVKPYRISVLYHVHFFVWWDYFRKLLKFGFHVWVKILSRTFNVDSHTSFIKVYSPFQRCNLQTVSWRTGCLMYLYFRQLI